MNWYKISKLNIETKIKNIFKTHPLFINLLKEYNIDKEDIDNKLDIKIKELDGQFSIANSKVIYLDPKIIDNLFEENFHFVTHEFFHWIKRRHEKEFYFNDPEETQCFVLAAVWELMDGKNINDIKKKIFPIINNILKDKQKSEIFFNKIIKYALDIKELFKNV